MNVILTIDFIYLSGEHSLTFNEIYHPDLVNGL